MIAEVAAITGEWEAQDARTPSKRSRSVRRSWPSWPTICGGTLACSARSESRAAAYDGCAQRVVRWRPPRGGRRRLRGQVSRAAARSLTRASGSHRVARRTPPPIERRCRSALCHHTGSKRGLSSVRSYAASARHSGIGSSVVSTAALNRADEHATGRTRPPHPVLRCRRRVPGRRACPRSCADAHAARRAPARGGRRVRL